MPKGRTEHPAQMTVDAEAGRELLGHPAESPVVTVRVLTGPLIK